MTTEAIASDSELSKSIALITDGRFSGASERSFVLDTYRRKHPPGEKLR